MSSATTKPATARTVLIRLAVSSWSRIGVVGLGEGCRVELMVVVAVVELLEGVRVAIVAVYEVVSV